MRLFKSYVITTLVSLYYCIMPIFTETHWLLHQESKDKNGVAKTGFPICTLTPLICMFFPIDFTKGKQKSIRFFDI